MTYLPEPPEPRKMKPVNTLPPYICNKNLKDPDRIHIIDPVAAQSKGHNIACLLRYKGLFSTLFPSAQVIAYGSTMLKETTYSHDIQGIDCESFSFQYADILPITDSRGLPVSAESFEYPVPQPIPFDKNSPHFEKVVLRHERARIASDKEFNEFFSDHELCEDDLLFLPSADIYAALSACRALETRKPKSSPFIALKLIHVSEFWSPLHEDCLLEIILAAKSAIDNGHKVAILTEADGYSKYIRSKYSLHAIAAPMPMEQPSHRDYTDLSRSERVILFPGSQRLDKGADQIPSIINHLNKKNGINEASFHLQLPGPSSLCHLSDAYIDMYKWPNVKIHPSSIAQDCLTSLYRSSRLVCLPYCPHTYNSLRSSASYVEAAMLCRPVVARRCEGFANAIEQFNLGLVGDDPGELAELISQFLQADPSTMAKTQFAYSYLYYMYVLSCHLTALREPLLHA